MTCGKCDCLGSKSVRYLPPEVLGMEATRFDEDGESLPVRLVSYSCNYWDDRRHSGEKTSIATSVKLNTVACTRFIPKMEDVTHEFIKTNNWIEERQIKHNKELLSRNNILKEAYSKFMR